MKYFEKMMRCSRWMGSFTIFFILFLYERGIGVCHGAPISDRVPSSYRIQHHYKNQKLKKSKNDIINYETKSNSTRIQMFYSFFEKIFSKKGPFASVDFARVTAFVANLHRRAVGINLQSFCTSQKSENNF